MKNIHFILAVLIISLSWLSCRQTDKAAGEASKSEHQEGETMADSSAPANTFVSQSVNDELAAKVSTFITSEYLQENDLKVISETDRKFQIYQIDLNDDGKNEIFVNFLTPYFCGTGGCSLVLLDNDLKPIARFTTIRTPIFAEQVQKNGWRVLLTRTGEGFKELDYTNTEYPAIAPKVDIDYDAPSGHAEVMFDEEFSKAKTYEF